VYSQQLLFKYNEIQNAITPIQDPILIQYCNQYHHSTVGKYLALSNGYLVFWDNCDAALYIYKLDPDSETYTFHQRLNMEGVLRGGLVYSIAIDKDVLVLLDTVRRSFLWIKMELGLNRYQLLRITSGLCLTGMPYSRQVEKFAHTVFLRTVPNHCQHLLLR
jgi:hypothetical protein